MEISNNIEEQLKYLATLQELNNPTEQFRSDEISELATAYAKAQGEYPTIRYNRLTSMFQNEYTDLDLIMRTIRPVLSKHGLSFFQITKFDKSGMTLLDSFLLHSSGQWMKSQTRIVPSKDDKMVKISETNTEKRIQAQTLLNITVIDDLLDDNSEKANEDYEIKQAEGTDLNYKYNPKMVALRITKSELADVQYELKDLPDVAAHLLDRLKIETFADMPKDQYHKVIEYIRRVAKDRATPKPTVG
jgi:hypothetical protein